MHCYNFFKRTLKHLSFANERERDGQLWQSNADKHTNKGRMQNWVREKDDQMDQKRLKKIWKKNFRNWDDNDDDDAAALKKLSVNSSSPQKRVQVLISPTFYAQLFCTKVFWAAFLYLRLRIVFFWHKEMGANAEHKMLVKLTSKEVFDTKKDWMFI